MATLLSEAIKLVIVSLISLGISSFLMVSAHESHDHETDPVQFAMNAVSHETAHDLTDDESIGLAESIHGHSHDELSHDHTVEVLGDQAIHIEHTTLTVPPDDPAPSIYGAPVFEIAIPPRN